MSMKERIKDLCKSKGVSLNKLEQELGFGSGYISKLDKSTPNSKNLQKIAEYFSVPTDYLVTGKMGTIIETVKTDVELSLMEDRLKAYALKLAKLPKDKQVQIMSLIDMLEDK